MPSPRRRRMAALTFLFAGLSVAPAAPQQSPPAGPSPLAQARYDAAVKQFEIIWSYFQQDRTDSFQVYVWSRLVLDAPRDGRDAGRSPRRSRGPPGTDEADGRADQEDPAAGLRPIVRRGGVAVLSSRGGALAGPGGRRGGLRVHRPAGAGAAAPGLAAGAGTGCPHRQKQSSGSSAMNSRAWSRARIVPYDPTARHRSW